ncbi:MAG: hypothetical protein WAX80_01100 [Minisyncoccia bacterium]
MTFAPQQIRESYKRLPPEIQDLIMSNETTELVAKSLREAGLNQDQENLADSEILYTMYCLQSLDEAISNITKLSGKDLNSLSKLKSVIQDNILSKYKIDIKEFIEANKLEPVATLSVPEIAPDNLPMVEKGEVAHSVPHVEQTTHDSRQTTNQEQPKVQTPLPDYRYPDSKDPYREPLK